MLLPQHSIALQTWAKSNSLAQSETGTAPIIVGAVFLACGRMRVYNADSFGDQSVGCTMRRVRILLLSLLVLALLAPIASASGPIPVTIYHSPTCSACEMFKQDILPNIEAAYALEITYVDVSQSDGLAQLEAEEAKRDLSPCAIPCILVGDDLLADEDVFGLEEQLTEALDRFQAAQPTAERTPDPTPTTPVQVPATVQAPTIHVAYITREGCEQCSRGDLLLDLMADEFPGLIVHRFDHIADGALVEAMGRELGLGTAQRLIAPSLYVGSTAIIDDDLISINVRQALSLYADTGAEPFWQELETSEGRASILQRFSAMGPWAVVVAGLIDGVNPCAFATILFFVSYLAISRRRRRDLLLIGIAFTLGVFITYLVIGLGAMSLLRLAHSVRALGYVLYGLMALSCLVLAAISILDYFKARRGELGEMTLKLSEGARDRIKGRIRAASGAFMGAAFVSGMLVSLMELACTGQVYLPTISFVVGIPEMRGSAVLYLLLYNVMFVLPLVVVMLLAVYGVSAVRFQEWFVKNAAATKLLTAILFVALAGVLITQILTL